MNHPVPSTTLNCQGITDLLCRRFEIQHGCELVPIVGFGHEASNQAALLGWVRRRVDFYQECGVDRPLLYLDAELAQLLIACPYLDVEFSEEICIRVPDLPERPEPDRSQPIPGGGSDLQRPVRARPQLSLVPKPSNGKKGE